MRGCTGCASSSALSAVDRLAVPAGGAVLEHLPQPLAPRRRTATSFSVTSAACQLSAPKNARTWSSVSTWAFTRSTAVRAYSSKFTGPR